MNTFYSVFKRKAIFWMACALFLLLPNALRAHDGQCWMSSGYRASGFAGGNGTESNPYRIATAGQLAYLAYGVNMNTLTTSGKYFKLTADIDLGDHLWEPIGYYSTNSAQPTRWFAGTFDGDGYTVGNMTVAGADQSIDGIRINHGSNNNYSFKGLFGYTGSEVTIKNLTIKNVYINAYQDLTYYSGALLGYAATNLAVENVHIEGGRIQARWNIGGMVGCVNGTTTIARSSCSMTIDPASTGSGGIGNGNNTGGIIGYIMSGRTVLKHVLFNGTIVLNDVEHQSIGGIVGYAEDINNTYRPGLQLENVLMSGTWSATTPSNSLSNIGKIAGSIADQGDATFATVYSRNSDYRTIGNISSTSLPVTVLDDNSINGDNVLSALGSKSDGWYKSNGKIVRYQFVNPKPGNLTATVEPGRIKLTWAMDAGNPYTPTTAYTIQTRKQGTSDNSWVNVTLQSGSNLNYDVTENSKTVYADFPGLNDAGTQYEFRITRDNWVHTASASCAVPACSLPRNLHISQDANEGRITLAWNITPQQDASALTGNYEIQWKTGSATDYVALTNFTSGNLNYNRPESSHSVTFAYPVMKQGIKNFLFRIRRTDYSFTAHSLEGSISVNTDAAPLTHITATGDTSGINVEWNTGSGVLKSEWYYRLYRKMPEEGNFNYTGNSLVDEIQVEKASTLHRLKDTKIAACSPADYIVRLEEGSSPGTVHSASSVMEDHAVTRLPVISGSIDNLQVSKGYYNDRVEISWTIPKGSSFNRFAVKRREALVNGASPQTLYSENVISPEPSYRFTDHTAIAGVYYKYDVIAYVDCNGSSTEGDKKTTIGYVQPFGIVSGKVTYEGGTAVKGVSILAENDPTTQYANRAIQFEAAKGTFVQSPYKDGTLAPDAFTFQGWVMLTAENTPVQTLMDSHYRYGIEITPDRKIRFSWFNSAGVVSSHDFNYELPVRQYAHLSISRQVEGASAVTTLYVNGKRQDTWTATVNNTGFHATPTDPATPGYYTFFGASGGNTQPLTACVDEVRLWKTALDSTTIAGNYDCFLTGRENYLALYYHFDSPIADYAFDISKTGNEFNENHGEVHAYMSGKQLPERTTDYVPPIYNKAITDESGNYLLTTIPYSGEGSSVRLVPAMGVHSFNPADKQMFFNQSSTTYNNVDFVDNSSFKVKGHIYYDRSNYPVEGVTLKVDGIPANRDGALLQTDANGAYEISVPIGRHYISAEKQGHSFAAGGRFPAYEEDLYEQKRYNFNDSISGIDFSDITKVRIAGRVAGGNMQKNLPLGFGLSKANIGAATVTLKNDRLGVYFDTSDASAQTGGRTTRTHLETSAGQGTFATIYTDSVTGEFLAVLPPIP
ncbi:MAG: hypothetical protein LBC40_01785, partial [Dysgonamonadaceae bacterium]|nr:hypothetical protein [Dysgonamonadaceae bacterium]